MKVVLLNDLTKEISMKLLKFDRFIKPVNASTLFIIYTALLFTATDENYKVYYPSCYLL